MITNITSVRVRYGETDQMSYVYYGNYALYYEVGRGELLRQIGTDYVRLEEEGFLLPVAEMNIKFLFPGKYDELLQVTTILKEFKGPKLFFEYEIHNSEGKLINIGTSTLIFMNKKSQRPTRPPKYFVQIIDDYLNKTN